MVSYVPTIKLGRLNIKASICELIATCLFVFIGCGTASTFSLVTTPDGVELPSVKADATDVEKLQFLAASITTTANWGVTTALAFGTAIMVLVFATAHTSGGQINPAVTMGLVLTGNLPVVQGVANTLAQLGSALLGEIIMTLVLVLTVLETVCNPRSRTNMLAPIAIGFAVFCGHAVLLPIDGCAINPARWFGPAVVSGKAWESTSWIFVVGPYIGSLVAAVIHVFSASKIGDIEEFEPTSKVLEVAEDNLPTETAV